MEQTYSQFLHHENRAGVDALLEHTGHRLLSVNSVVPVVERYTEYVGDTGVFICGGGSHQFGVYGRRCGDDFHH